MGDCAGCISGLAYEDYELEFIDLQGECANGDTNVIVTHIFTYENGRCEYTYSSGNTNVLMLIEPDGSIWIQHSYIPTPTFETIFLGPSGTKDCLNLDGTEINALDSPRCGLVPTTRVRIVRGLGDWV